MFKKKPPLCFFFISITTGCVVLTSLIFLAIILFFQKNDIKESILKSNYIHASELAEITNSFLFFAQKELAWTASKLHSMQSMVTYTELENVRMRTGFFNVIGVISTSDKVISIPPRNDMVKSFESIYEGIKHKKTLNKNTTIITYNNDSLSPGVTLYYPIKSFDGTLIGYVFGCILLNEKNIISDVISVYSNEKNKTINITNAYGKKIYSFSKNKIKNISGQYSKINLKNNKGSFIDNENIYGYAILDKLKLYVVISTSNESVYNQLNITITRASWLIFIIVLLASGVVAFFSSYITHPLAQLTRKIQSFDIIIIPEKISAIQPWYKEAELLKDAINSRFRTVTANFCVLKDEAMTDPLTGLYNRRGFREQSKNLKNIDSQYLIAIDIDHFKVINDLHGHEIGDAALVKIAKLLRSTCRKSDVISRFGGEEFIILLPDSSLSGASTTAERIRHVMARATFEKIGHLTVSIGVAGLKKCHGDHEKLLREADKALYQAKRQGRNQVVIQ